MRIIGHNEIGSNFDTGDRNVLDGSPFNSGQGGNLAFMSVYVGAVDSAPNNQFQLGVYTNADGRPGTLVAHTATGTLTANSWNTLPITGALQPNTIYWLVYNTNATSDTLNNMAVQLGVGTYAWSSAAILFGTWPSTYGVLFGSGTFSIYATYRA